MRSARTGFASACALFILSFSVLNAQPRTGRFAETFDNNGITSTINYYVPEDYDSTKAYPFFFAWHGAGMPGSSMCDLMYILIAQRIKAIAVCPDANNCQTNDQLNNLIDVSYDRAAEVYNIDTTRRVITGFSWGGRISFELGLLNPLMFDGIIGFAPAVGSLTQPMWDNIGRIRMATILGDQDFNFNAVDALMKQIPTRGGALLYMVKPGVVHADNVYFNSQEFRDDYAACYDFVLGLTGAAEVPAAAHPVVTVTPAPARDYCFIQVERAEGAVIGVQVTDIRGRVMYASEPADFGGEIPALDTSRWPAGVYFAHLTIGNRLHVRMFPVVH